MKKYADLHIHTTYSDGSLTPQEAIFYAKKAGFCCIAICDHDCVDGLGPISELQESHGIEIIPGVEITAEEDKKEIHMLGYLVDWQNKKLKDALLSIRESRIARLYKIVDKLKACGVNADAKEIMEFAGDVSLSRLHIGRYLYIRGFVSSLREAFDKYIGDGKPCYISNFRFSSKGIIDIIKDAGGISVIAHPGLNGVEKILPILVKNKIDGIEAYHSEHPKAASDRLKRFAEENNLLITGGSDCHGAHTKERPIGKIKLPYEYVERLKIYAKSHKAGEKKLGQNSS